MQQKGVSEKGKLILFMTYTTHYLPIAVLSNFPRTFTSSNITYKLVPNLINTGYIKRILCGYNKKYGENEVQVGKALYDTLVLTKKGISYVKHIGKLNSESELTKIRKEYSQILSNNTMLGEERLKRMVLCDYMFAPEKILIPIIKTAPLKPGATRKLKEELGNLGNPDENKYRYFRAIDYKRVNGNLGTLKELGTFIESNSQAGLAISGSKIFGILNTDSKTIPIYETGYGKNVRIVPEKENDLIGKIVAYTRAPCNDAVYVYHGIGTVQRLVKRKDVEDKWKNQTHIIDLLDFQRIYLIPYGRGSVPFKHLTIQMSIPDKDMRQYWIKNNCFDFHDYILANPYVKETYRSSQEQFISIDESYNYIIGYLPELRHLRKVYRYYEDNPNAKPLVVVCDETQIDFFKAVFENILKQNKLNFTCSEFREVGTTDEELGTSRSLGTGGERDGTEHS